MDKLLAEVFKVAPVQVVLGIACVGLWFFLIYYLKGLRSYADTFEDSLFLYGAVIVAAVSMLALIQARPIASPLPGAAGNTNSVLVPYFTDDERDQFAAGFVNQIEAAASEMAAGKPRTIVVRRYKSILGDSDAAKRLATELKSSAVIYGGRVFRFDSKTYLGMSILTLNPETERSIALVEALLPQEKRTEIVKILNTISYGATPPLRDSFDTRLAAVEGQLQELRTAVLNQAGRSQSAASGGEKENRGRRIAVVLGVSESATVSSPFPSLRTPPIDTARVSELFETLGFEVERLLNGSAERIMETVLKWRDQLRRDDQFIVYFTGHSVVETSLGPPALWLVSSDWQPGTRDAGIGLGRLVSAISKSAASQNMLILDASLGTVGLRVDQMSTSTVNAPPESLNAPPDGAKEDLRSSLYVLSGTLDNQISVATPAGALFTRELISIVRKQVVEDRQPLAVDELFFHLTRRMAGLDAGTQLPTLVRVRNTGNFVLVPTVRTSGQKVPSP